MDAQEYAKSVSEAIQGIYRALITNKNGETIGRVKFRAHQKDKLFKLVPGVEIMVIKPRHGEFEIKEIIECS